MASPPGSRPPSPLTADPALQPERVVHPTTPGRSTVGTLRTPDGLPRSVTLKEEREFENLQKKQKAELRQLEGQFDQRKMQINQAFTGQASMVPPGPDRESALQKIEAERKQALTNLDESRESALSEITERHITELKELNERHVESRADAVANRALDGVRGTFAEVKKEPEVTSAPFTATLGGNVVTDLDEDGAEFDRATPTTQLNLRCSIAKNKLRAGVEKKDLKYIGGQSACIIEHVYAACEQIIPAEGFIEETKKDAESAYKTSVWSEFGGPVIEELRPKQAAKIRSALRNLKGLSIKRLGAHYVLQIRSKANGKDSSLEIMIKDPFTEFEGKGGIAPFTLNDFFNGVEDLIQNKVDTDSAYAEASGYTFYQAYTDNWGLHPGTLKSGRAPGVPADSRAAPSGVSQADINRAMQMQQMREAAARNTRTAAAL